MTFSLPRTAPSARTRPLLQKTFSKIPQFSRFVKFCIVGGSGVVVNAGLFRLLLQTTSFDYRLASIIAIETAIANNFLWNYLWTFNDRKTGDAPTALMMFLRFNLTSGMTAMVVNWGLLVTLKELFGIYEEIANLIGIAAGTISNYLLSHFWAFAAKSPGH
ncbi:MAG: hypothetical protein GF418_15320 [Chitinivibrionales bacterium]|nr:hypothetical protein [Chitinivibrionales bacterium]MBD3396992.1 hypothetical protein [Chitinivibrionales bacterium]